MIGQRAGAGRSLLLVIGGVAGAALGLSGAVVFLIHALTGSVFPADAAGLEDRLQAGILGISLLLVAILSVVAVYHGIEWMRKIQPYEAVLRPRGPWQILLLVVLWLGSVWGAQAVLRLPSWKWSAAVLHALAIAVPIYALLLLATTGLRAGSSSRAWGTFTAGMWLATGTALVAEALLGVLAVLAATVYLATRPDYAALLQRIVRDVGASRGLPEAFNAARPLLSQPIALFVALLVFAGVAPVIEETAKSVTSWLVVDLLQSPAAGFASGALGGAGFALVEGLFASANPDMFWGTTLFVRAGSSMMHIASAAIAGYGIAAFWISRRPAALAGGYLGAVTLHALWNASIITLTFGGIRLSDAGVSQPRLVGWLMVVTGVAVLAALCFCTPLAVWISNRRLRRASETPSAPGAATQRTDESGSESRRDVGK